MREPDEFQSKFTDMPFSQSKYSVSKEEQQILNLLMCAMGNDKDESNLCYTFRISDYSPFFAKDTEESLYQSFIRRILSLQNNWFKFADEDGVYESCILQSVICNNRRKEIKVMVGEGFKASIDADRLKIFTLLPVPKKCKKEDFTTIVENFI